MNEPTPPAELVRRIRERNPQAEEEMVRRYRPGAFQIINQIVRNHAVAEDLCQETLMKALEKTRRGDVREPEKYSGFVSQMARFIAIEYIRKKQAAVKDEDAEAANQVPDLSPDPYEQVLEKENAQLVQKVLKEMKVPRDRDILFRFYILEEDKDDICAALGLSRDQFSRVIFRALQRFKELHQKLAGKT